MAVLGRRKALATGSAALLALFATDCTRQDDATARRTALVYRGPAACKGCAESAVRLLNAGRHRLEVVYCGPDERLPLTSDALASAAVYVQPGGGDLDSAWPHLSDAAGAVRAWVRQGGIYLGFCLGAYLAGDDPGFDLLPGSTGRYIDARGAEVTTTDDTVIAVSWRNRERHLYFQDGPYFDLDDRTGVDIVATYTNGLPAALVAEFGAGRVGVVGPHPEADESWYADGGPTNPDGIRLDLGHDFVRSAFET